MKRFLFFNGWTFNLDHVICWTTNYEATSTSVKIVGWGHSTSIQIPNKAFTEYMHQYKINGAVQPKKEHEGFFA